MIDGALAFQDYVRKSDLNSYDPETHLGCWKQLTARTTEDGQLMLYIHISPRVCYLLETHCLMTISVGTNYLLFL
jgi:hypothetical protein